MSLELIREDFINLTTNKIQFGSLVIHMSSTCISNAAPMLSTHLIYEQMCMSSTIQLYQLKGKKVARINKSINSSHTPMTMFPKFFFKAEECLSK